MIELKNMENTEVLAFAGYQEFEAAADRTAVKIKEGYLEMGYILKMARDTDILRESGYAGYEEFAEKRYGLDKGTVSRYIRIVERFSVGGNSHVLMDNYKNMGFAKLSIMLHMPDAIAEELMDSLSKTEVQAIREELEEEEKVSDIELAIEGAEAAAAVQPLMENMLTRAIWQLGREQHELYRKLWKAFKEGDRSRVKDIFAPQGDAVYMPRIPGTGRMMITISGEQVSVTAVRTQEKERYTVEELINAAEQICPVEGADATESFRQIYDEELEEQKRKEVAPVQPKQEKRKESKVTKAKPKEAKKEAPLAAAAEEEPQLPGQMNVGDYPGIVPEASYREIDTTAAGSSREEEKNDGSNDESNEQGGTPEESYEEPGYDPGTTEGAGDTGTVGESGNAPGDGAETEGALEHGIQQHDAGNGATESGGREADHGVAEEDIWMEVRAAHQKLNQYMTIWNDKESLMEMDMLQNIYTRAIDLAAAVEKIMLVRTLENE